jgi:hypothetical protein
MNEGACQQPFDGQTSTSQQAQQGLFGLGFSGAAIEDRCAGEALLLTEKQGFADGKGRNKQTILMDKMDSVRLDAVRREAPTRAPPILISPASGL